MKIQELIQQNKKPNLISGSISLKLSRLDDLNLPKYKITKVILLYNLNSNSNGI
jgi:hypothetical protein